MTFTGLVKGSKNLFIDLNSLVCSSNSKGLTSVRITPSAIVNFNLNSSILAVIFSAPGILSENAWGTVNTSNSFLYDLYGNQIDYRD